MKKTLLNLNTAEWMVAWLVDYTFIDFPFI